eukprot:gene6112-9386_t
MASAGARSAKRGGGEQHRSGEGAADFPILCETCLGPNPFLRMIRCEYSKECNVCKRPMTNFRWKPGKDSRYKNTVVCQTCAKLKNTCQCCLFDLAYGLPTAVRDHYAQGDTVQRHESDVQLEYFARQNEKMLNSGALTPHQSGASKHATNPELMKLARTGPRYARNRPHVCSFFAQGMCNRGKECPYRHEVLEDNELSKQNIRDRYYGTNDPVANKILREKKEADEALSSHRELIQGAAADDADFDPSSIPLPPGPAPDAGQHMPDPSAALNIPAYPST